MDRLKEKKCFVLDMDGTIYLSSNVIPGADDFIRLLHARGIRAMFVTNNSSKNKAVYYERLRGMNIPCEKNDILTSGDAACRYVQKIKPHARIFLLGTPSLEKEFSDAGFMLTTRRDERIDFVVLGFDTTLTYEKLWIACDYVRAGIPYIATHPDFNCPLPNNAFMPDTGAMIAFIQAATQRYPIVIGKPYPHMIDFVLSEYTLQKKDVVVVGDRLYTDIRMANDAGIDSILVLSGESTKEMCESSPCQPTYIVESVKDIIKLLG